MQAVNIVIEQSADICPAGASADEIIFIVSPEIIHDRMLVHGPGITAGRAVSLTDIGDASDYGPHATGRSIGRRKTLIKKNTLVTHAFKKGRRVQWISPHRTFVSAE